MPCGPCFASFCVHLPIFFYLSLEFKPDCSCFSIMTSPCALCGSVAPGRRSMQRVVDLKVKVASGWLQGPFAYHSFMGSQEESCTCCSTCLRTSKKGKKKKMLPMDQFLIWLLTPKYTMDQRLWRRMKDALTTEGEDGSKNSFASLGHFYTLANAKNPARAWWERSLKTNFFWSKETARIVRSFSKELINE